MYINEITQGFFLGGSLIVAIGAQNAFVLSQSLKGNHEWLIAPLSMKKAMTVTLALTLFNPHVYLDTVMLIGSIANTKFPDTQWWFAAGAILASFVWFYGLTAFAKVLIPLFNKPRTWQILDGLIGITMWVIAWSLVKYILT